MSKIVTQETHDSLALHSAGATVRHKGGFANLKVLENDQPLEQAFIAKYVIPFYMKEESSDEFRENLLAIKDLIDCKVVSRLLGEFNWRPRSVGAYFAALGGMIEHEENIGNLLLRSDVCYAGSHYCLALASFSSPAAIHYLQQYLEYYLRQPDLWFDQSSAMAALSYIGRNRGEDLIAPYMVLWNTFIVDKPSWHLHAFCENFNQQMQSLNDFKRDIII